MSQEVDYGSEATTGYDEGFGHVSQHFVPFLLRAARLAPGMHVLDVASGTGLAAAGALSAVGPTGSVLATDVSPGVLAQAEQRLSGAPNFSVAVEDGQSLSLPESTFDAVICGLGLMFFPEPARGVSEFRRVLRPGGRVAASVNTSPERSYIGLMYGIIARHVPDFADVYAGMFSLGNEATLRSLFEAEGFRNVEITTETRRFTMPSFDSYFGPFERGGVGIGQGYARVPHELRSAVREELQRGLRDSGGPIELEVEIRFASGQR